jgi:hypothetical protein
VLNPLLEKVEQKPLLKKVEQKSFRITNLNLCQFGALFLV